MHPLKRRMDAGEAAIGTFVFLRDPAVVEIAGLAGMDFVVIDMEHTTTDFLTAENMVRAAEVVGISALVRVAHNSPALIQSALETGAAGIMVPQVESAADVRAARDAMRYPQRAARDAMRYPPEGTRGTCSMTRAARYGSRRPDFAEYAADTARSLVLVALVETRTGAECIDEIVAAHPDVLCVGRADLAASIGVIGQKDHPDVLDATARIEATVAADPSVVFGDVPRSAPDGGWITAGARFLIYDSESAALFYRLGEIADGLRDATEGGRR